MGENQEKPKKEFISEKIVGRKFGAGQVAKALLAALLCGALFGAGAAIMFHQVRAHSQKAEVMLPETSEEAEVSQEEQEEDAGDSDRTQQPSEEAEDADGGNRTNAADTPSETDAQNAFSMLTEEERDTYLRELIREEISEREYTEEDLDAFFAKLQEIAEDADSHVVSVQAVSRETGWFDDTIETAQLASGVILSTTDPEILILTTSDAVKNADSLGVVFKDGTAVANASIKSSSELDGIAIVAVPKNGLGTEFLSSISPIRFGNSRAIRPGELLIAVGSPLSVPHSFDFGFAGYRVSNETTADGIQEVLYADLRGNAQKGSFIVNMDGELCGMCSSDNGNAVITETARILSASWLKEIGPFLREGRAIPYIGIEGKTVDTGMQAEGLPAGVFVTDVRPDSPAYAAGIRNGDVVTGLNDVVITDMTGYEAAVRKTEAGEAVTVKVLRSSVNNEYRELGFLMNAGAR